MTAFIVRMVTEKFHRDDEDRPLREGRTPPEFLREGDLEFKRCPYAGSRHDHEKPMNTAALLQTSAHWDELLDALRALRSGYGRPVKSIMDIWRVSQLGSALPWWHLSRGETIPAYAAALSKATLGAGIWAQQMLMRELTGWTAPALDAATIVSLAEDSGTLIGRTEVCSGSDKMLAKFFEVYVDDSTSTRDVAAAVRFGAHYAQLKLVMWLYCLARRYLLHDLGGERAGALLEAGVEPPDFFIVEPPEPTKVPALQRMAWFARLAQLVVPFAADGSDRPHAMAAMRIAAALGAGAPPAPTFAALDDVFADTLARAETAFGGDQTALTVGVRDSLIADGTRALFTAT